MAKHRSKKNRILAEQHRLSRSKFQVSEKIVKKEENLQEIFNYDPKLIVKDLRKTVLLVTFILLILLTIALIYT